MTPNLSVLLPTYRQPKALAETLCDLAAQDYPREHWRLVIVDDGSGDNSSAVAVRDSPLDVPLTLLRRTSGGHYSHAALFNEMIRHAASDTDVYVHIEDVRLPRDFLTQHAKWHQQGHYRHLVTGPMCEGPEVTFSPEACERWSLMTYDEPGSIAYACCFQAVFAKSMSYPSAMLLLIDHDAHGPFDESMSGWGYHETEFAFRAERAGYLCVYDSRCPVYHPSHRQDDEVAYRGVDRNSAVETGTRLNSEYLCRKHGLIDLPKWRVGTPIRDYPGGLAAGGRVVIAGEVGIVLLDLDQPELTSRCLGALEAGASHPAVVVVVRNGGSVRWPTSSTATPWGRRLQTIFIDPPTNLGCAGGRNAGLRYLDEHTSTCVYVVLDNDTVPPTDFIESLLVHAPSGGEVVAPVIRDLHTGLVWSSGGRIAADGAVLQLAEVPADVEPYETDWVPGACLVMHRDTWRLTGRFDEWISFLFEDIEWCYRLTRLGGKVIVVPSVQLAHEPHQSLGGRWSPSRVRYWARNGTFFRVHVVRADAGAVLSWLVSELGLALHDLCRGSWRASSARVAGLAAGLAESARRRSARSRTTLGTADQSQASAITGERPVQDGANTLPTS